RAGRVRSTGVRCRAAPGCPWLLWRGAPDRASSWWSRLAAARVDEVFLAGGALAVAEDHVALERLGQRDLAAVVAGEGGLQFAGHALLERLRRMRSHAVEKRHQ